MRGIEAEVVATCPCGAGVAVSKGAPFYVCPCGKTCCDPCGQKNMIGGGACRTCWLGEMPPEGLTQAQITRFLVAHGYLSVRAARA